jgi:Protein of unknown function (DUF4238)
MQEHHYLPQFYQRRWGDENGRLIVYQRPHDRVIASLKPTKATGKRAGLYTVAGVPLERANELEDRFWRKIDQWGADAIVALESSDPIQMRKLNKERWSIFVTSLLVRNPIEVERINVAVRSYYENNFSRFKEEYEILCKDYEPSTFAEFMALFREDGLVELTAKILHAFILNEQVRRQLMSMNWDVVSVTNSTIQLLTSDNPIIRHKGLKDDDCLLMLPIGPNEFFVAHNAGPKDMLSEINRSIKYSQFLYSMNKYVVAHAVAYVYGSDASHLDFVERHLRGKNYGATSKENFFLPNT